MKWSINSWQDFPIKQFPEYSDKAKLLETEKELAKRPPLVFAEEVRRLRRRLALVAEGKSFLLQGGDCAESFLEHNANNIRDSFKVILQMAAVLTFGSSLPVVKIGRFAGQYSKPRSSPVEVIDGIELPSYKGDMINDMAFNKVSRENISLKIRAFCNAMSNNLPAIDLIISLIIEEETYDDELVYILNSYLNETEININKIKHMDLFKLNLINNKNIDFSEIINENSEIELQLFYVLAKTKSNIKKISLTENLLSRGIINSVILADVYEKYMTENEIEIDIDLNSLSLGVEKRALLYNQIRKTSNQDELISLASIYVQNMGNVNLLNNSANLIYDKIKVISPKQEHRKHAPAVCLLLLLNNDFDQCRNWLSNLDFVSEAEEIKTKIRLYLSLSNNITDFNQNDIDYLLSSDDELSEKQKNILVKYSELKYQEDLIDYWKSENEFNQIQTILPNIKLVEYLKSIPLKNKGEIILLISLIHGNQPSNSLDQYSLFLIMESLNKLDPIYLDNFVFEYLVNNPV